KKRYPTRLDENFLNNYGLVEDGFLTNAGVLLFGNNTSKLFPSSILYLVEYNGNDITFKCDNIQFEGPIITQITNSFKMVKSKIKTWESITGDSSSSKISYDYPTTCLREVIANAVIHRDYEDQKRNIHINIFTDKIEIKNPGKWYSKILSENKKKYKIEELISGSKKNNPRLALIAAQTRNFEGQGGGISKAVKDCKKIGCPIPDVIMTDNFITVIVFPKRTTQHAEKIELLRHYSNFESKKKDKFIGELPVQSEIFFGREEDLERVHEKLFRDNILLLVNGTGGIGKTTLAAHYYHRYADEYSSLIWAVAIPDIDTAFNSIALSLRLQFEPDISPEDKIKSIIRAIAELEKPCLFVIDNANDHDELSEYYKLLRSLPDVHIILTSRVMDLSTAETYKIGCLEKDVAIEFFKTLYPGCKSAEDMLLNEILQAVDYHTLAIEILAKNLANLNKLRNNYTLENLKEDLFKKGVLQLSKSKEVTTDYKKAEPKEIIESMYDISGLNDQEKNILSILSVLPTNNILF
ncbi:MAG: hypothetical protein D3923_14355, partial [Candidatus Electrothrix sp. AR3]|nr:hypothetical protein [Candidatus Electrothrix sp. AR3]